MAGTRVLAAAAVGAMLVSWTAAAAPATATQQNIAVKLAYTCQFSTGPQNVSAEISGTFPAKGTVGVPIQPTNIQVALAVPQGALDATSVSGSAQLTVTVAQAAATDAKWPGLAIPMAAPGESGALDLVAGGTVPTVTVSEAGDVTFSAAGLDLALNGLSVPCTPASGQKTQLAVVTVSAAAGSSTTSPSTSTGQSPASPGRKIEIGASTATPLAAAGVQAQAINAPDHCFDIVTTSPSPGCAYEVGFSNVNKQHASVLFGSPQPGFLQIAYSEARAVNLPCDSRFPPYYGNDGFDSCTLIQIDSRAILDQLTSDSSLLTFGFMPVTATVKMVPTKDFSILTYQQQRKYKTGVRTRYSIKVIATATVNIMISDVKVNGTDLDVGPNCRTATPITVTLNGGAASTQASNPDEYTVQDGGPLSGYADIPEFTGCGVTENLNPLLTGTISGPGNFVKMTQGKPCFKQGAVCPPTVPAPRR